MAGGLCIDARSHSARLRARRKSTDLIVLSIDNFADLGTSISKSIYSSHMGTSHCGWLRAHNRFRF